MNTFGRSMDRMCIYTIPNKMGKATPFIEKAPDVL